MLLSLHTIAVPPEQVPPRHASAVVHTLLSVQGAALNVWLQPVPGKQASSVQTLPSSQAVAVVTATHWPSLHVEPASKVVSLQLAARQTKPFVTLPCAQPVAGSHESFVHLLLSSQLTAVPGWQTPPRQTSPLVHALPSWQVPKLLSCVHPATRSQPSSVHTLPSSQALWLPGTHLPALQVLVPVKIPLAQLASPQTVPLTAGELTHPVLLSQESTVQGLPSSHAVMPPGKWVQPVVGAQLSSVHLSPSAQLTWPPPLHLPPAHASLTVQMFPSVQGVTFGVLTQPWVLGSQASSVHTLLSSQFANLPATHAPPRHASPLVQPLPSLQALPVPLGLIAQNPSTHASSVQTFLSSHSLFSLHAHVGLPPHTPPTHASLLVHALPSSQGALLKLFTHPAPGKHASSVHGLPSSQVLALPPTHLPLSQLSPIVQLLPSVHVVLSGAATKPHAPLVQVSWVHASLSSQSALLAHAHAGVPAQKPAPQPSSLVQTLPSSQPAALGVCAHSPDFASQVSSVHGFLSSQLVVTLPPRQTPPPHLSPLVHTLPSLQAAALLVWLQPVFKSHKSSVHGLSSSHCAFLPLPHTPALQASFWVQPSPSSQLVASSGACTQPVLSSQESVVQLFLSSQSAFVPTHFPPAQWSSLVHAFPSVHTFAVGACVQLPSAPQSSFVHGSPSSQSATTHVFASKRASPESVAIVSGCASMPLSATMVASLASSVPSTFVPSMGISSPPQAV